MEETQTIGQLIGQQLPSGSILCLYGELAAGKTTLMKGLVQGQGLPLDAVNSPTFVYLNIYSGHQTVYHFDLYRITSVDEFLKMGFDEYLFIDGVTCIEWPERIKTILPENCIHLFIKHCEEGCREITVEGFNGTLSI